jgi:D-alanine-D-alanine ligase
MSKIVILHGEVPVDAPADEQDVLVEVDTVAQALKRLGHDPIPVVFTLDLPRVLATLREIRPEVIFNLVESVGGKDRLIHLAPAVLDSIAIPYTGAPTEAVFLSSHKVLAKQRLRSAGIATPAWYWRGAQGEMDETETLPKGRYIIKSLWEHASIGLNESAIVEANDAAELGVLVNRRVATLGTDLFAEAFVEGREFNISLLDGPNGPEVLPHAEIQFLDFPDDKPRVVDYKAKWDEDSFEFQHTPRIFEFPASDSDLLRSLSEISKQCWQVFGLRGYARVDFRVDGDGKPWVLEININPCLSPDGGFHAAVQRAGLTIEQAAQRVLDAALRRRV